MTIEEIWRSSTHNDYSWLLPAVLSFGSATLILLNWIKSAPTRRTMKVLFAIGFAYAAIQASDAAIAEKWRIRWDWGHQNWDSLTEQEQNALCADGANLAMGPMIYGGGYSFLLFGGILLTSRVVRRIVTRKKSQQNLGPVSSAPAPEGAAPNEPSR